MKKVISLFLSVLMLFSSLSCITGIAADSVTLGENQIKMGDNVIGTYSNDHRTLTVSGTGKMWASEAIISDFPVDHQVAIRVLESITKLVLEEGITNIGEYSFCKTNITEVTIPDSVVVIEANAFEDCKYLEKVVFGKNINTIGPSAFYGCEKLDTLNLTESIKKIDSYAFGNCKALKFLNINNCTPELGYAVFSNSLKNLEKITVSDSNPAYCIENDILFNKDKTTLILYPAKKTGAKYTVPSTVTEISEKAFSHSANLSSITLPSKLKKIGNNAFYGIKNITNITIPKNITVIPNKAFASCSNLSKVTIHANKAITINKFAFENTTSGIKFYLPNKTVADSILNQLTNKFSGVKKADIYGNGNLLHTDITAVDSATCPNRVKLSTSVYTYNGKARKPSLTIKGHYAEKLTSKDYTALYSKGRKNVGKYTVTVKYKTGTYKGNSVKKTFIIIPKSTNISKLTASKKKFTVKWKKQASQTTGYQIQYSTNKSFKSAKTVTVSKNKTTAKTISKLKAKKKYYVRIRTYKTVKVNGKYTKIYSSWSKAKSVKVK